MGSRKTTPLVMENAALECNARACLLRDFAADFNPVLKACHVCGVIDVKIRVSFPPPQNRQAAFSVANSLRRCKGC